jgi:hypothetical protein
MTTTSTKVTVERQAGTLGALVTGVNLAHDLDEQFERRLSCEGLAAWLAGHQRAPRHRSERQSRI